MRNPEVSTAADYSLWDDADPDDVAGQIPAAPEGPWELTVGREGGRRLDKWLAEQLPDFSRSRLQTWIEAGAVLVEGEVATSLRQPIYPDQIVRVVPQPEPRDLAFVAEPMTLSIEYEDDTLLVIDKPAGLVVHPAAGNWSKTLLNGLLHHSAALAAVARAGIVHRLDKDTTGLMVVAKTALAQTDLVRQLQARSVRREYLALVLGAPAESGSFNGAIGRHPRDRLKMSVLPTGATGAKPALTHYRVLGRGKIGAFPTSLLALRLDTGRTHQIRVHLSDAGHPIIGDQVYANPGAKSLFPRQALHAGRLGLIHPQTKLPCSFESAPPQDLADLVAAASLAEALHDF